MMKFKIYYKEEGGGLLPNLGHVSVVNPKQVYDLKLIPFFHQSLALSSLWKCFVHAFVLVNMSHFNNIFS